MGFFGDIGEGISDVAGKVTGGAKSLGSSLFGARGSDTPDIDEENFKLQGADARRKQLLQQADFAAGRNAPGIAQSGFRGGQQGLVNTLQRQAAGQGPSLANQQLRDSLGRNVSSQQALLASGGNARVASQQAGQLGGSIANQAAQARVQEQLGAQQLLGSTLQGARSQDLQRGIAQSDAELRSRGLNDQQIARLRQMELQNAELGLRGTMGLESLRTQRRGQDLGVATTGENILGAASATAALI